MIVRCNVGELGEESILKLAEINSWGNHLNIIRQMNIDCIDIEELTKLIRDYGEYFDYYTMSYGLISPLTERKKVDLLLDLSGLGISIEITDRYACGNIEEMLSKMGIENIKFTKNYGKIVEIINMDDVEMGVLSEIFKSSSVSKYSLVDSLVECEIYKNGETVIKNLINGKNRGKAELGKVIKEEYIINAEMVEYEVFKSFSTSTYIPVFGMNIVKVKELMEHKWKVFESLKKLSVKDNAKLPSEVVSYLNSVEYIPYKELIEVISGKYKFNNFIPKEEG